MADPEARGRVAAIDIGSNSIHLVVVSPGRPGEFSVVAKEKYMVKLGAGTFQTRELSEESVAAGLEAAEAIARILEGAGVEEVAAVATSAVREAKNGKRFTSSFEERVGVRPAIISGREEARLIARAVQAALPLGDEQPLVIDIGGGSTELAVVGRQDELAWSLPLGVQRLLGEAE
ncbi:MAG: Ppx/GppA family phosphatase, partial [Polyangiaceae bacterium]